MKNTPEKITKAQWMKRCESAWSAGLVTPSVLHLISQWADIVLRAEHTLFSIGGQSQGDMVWLFLERERERLKAQNHLSVGTLASDTTGYNVVKLTALLQHPCQQCAEDPKAWHTRTAFCNHARKSKRSSITKP